MNKKKAPRKYMHLVRDDVGERNTGEGVGIEFIN
jgi:hypothetical protein